MMRANQQGRLKTMRRTHHITSFMIFQALLTLALGCGDGGGGGAATEGGDAATMDAGSDSAEDAAGDTSPAMDSATADAAPDADPGDTGPDPEAFNTPEEAFAAVDPLIGTGGEGYSYAALTPAAQVPLGMVRVGPDSTDEGFHWERLYHHSGYWYNDPDVRGFSHTHFVGTGVADFGHHRVMALREGDLERFEPGTAWASKDPERERGEPGYYETVLVEPEVEVELTATLHTGVHRYTPVGDERPMFLLFDAGSSVRDSGVSEAAIAIDGGRIEGEVYYTGGYSTRSRPYRIYVAATVDPPPEASWVWDDAGYQPDASEAGGGVKAGAVMRFAGDGPVVVKVGISYIDQEQAWANLDAEATPYTFDEVRAQAAAVWTEQLSQVQVAGGTARDRRVFFTALYNAYRMPTRFDEVGGRYRGFDGEVHELDGGAHYTDLSLWDTFRTLHPWYTLASPEIQRDCLRSLLRMAQQGDRGMPRWPAALSYTGGMIGRSADVLFGESALKGIDGVDYEAAADIMLAEAQPDPGDDPAQMDLLQAYARFGYVPQDLHDQSVSETLEHGYHDHALANLAAHLGRDAEAEALRARSRAYAMLFDADVGFFRPRLADGEFEADDDFDPTLHFERDGPFTEGSAWQWLFYVPHDPAGLAELVGGREALLERLETFFEESRFRSDESLDRILPDSYYWHGNQPSLHVVYLLGRLGDVARMSHWAREIQLESYGDGPDGLAGNDDGGTLSSWFLFSALGLFPVPGDAAYTISPPLFPRARLHLGDDRALTIEAPGASHARRIVTGVEVNGAPLDLGAPLIDHATLTEGDTTLQFTMEEE